jgi:hypothetical protein
MTRPWCGGRQPPTAHANQRQADHAGRREGVTIALMVAVSGILYLAFKRREWL